MRISKPTFAVLALAGVLISAGGALAQVQHVVDLDYSPVTQTVLVGDVFEVGLVARSARSDGLDVAFAGLSVILNWDPTKLAFQGVNNNGPYNWLWSGLPDDSAFDKLNADVNSDGIPDNDGDALYQGFPQFPPNAPAIATTSGLLVTSFVFEALDTTIAPTLLNMPLSAGLFSETFVLSGKLEEFGLLGTTGSATVTINEDCNGNGVADATDIANGTSQDCNADGMPDECPPCSVDCECNDANICTQDQCIGGTCENTGKTYGDVDNDRDVDLFDLFCILNCFENDFSVCSLKKCDLDPCEADGDVDLFDLFAVIGAFSGIDPCCGGLP